jgi:drug/metabolite transporter (DMT)-like permease
MKVAIAYLTVVLVWSTTPLGLTWSSETVHPSMAGFLRMAIALILGAILLRVWRIKLPMHANALKLYGFSCIGLFGGMFSSYLAAPYISTGMMSLAFGMSPIITGVLAYKLLDEPKLGLVKLVAIGISFTGLVIVFSDSVNLAEDAWIGILLITFAVCSFSYSAVLIKTVNITIHPAATMVGSMMFACPLYLVAWLIMDGTLPTQMWSQKSILSILYLGVFGSLVGFICYFYVLQKLTTSSVSLITMITPVFAIMLGSGLNNEIITVNVIAGAAGIILGLALYQQQSQKAKRSAKA